jgi:hypothetical protein
VIYPDSQNLFMGKKNPSYFLHNPGHWLFCLPNMSFNILTTSEAMSQSPSGAICCYEVELA